MERELALFNDYEVLTPSGWSSFDGISKIKDRNTATLSTANHSLICTLNHKVKTPDGFVIAADLTIGDLITTVSGVEAITHIALDEKGDVYDLLEVQKGNEYYTDGIVSHNCGFMGSSGTLITGSKLKTLVSRNPIGQREGFLQYEKPQDEAIYAILVDVARGKGLDYSAFHVIDITKMPYRQVAVYRSNTVNPSDYASVIFGVAKGYRDALVLVEVNDIGAQVAEMIYNDYEYENIVFTESAGRAGKRITTRSGSKVDYGIRTTTSVKSVGCSILKMLIEQDQLIINDFNSIQELSTFSQKGKSFEAEPGCHDDLVMGLVLFAWLTTQPYFKELNDINTIYKLQEKDEDELFEELTPFGIMIDGLDDDLEPGFWDEEPDVIERDIWSSAVNDL